MKRSMGISPAPSVNRFSEKRRLGVIVLLPSGLPDLAVFFILLYSPFILKRPWPEWAAGAGLGALPILGMYFVQSGAYTSHIVVACIPSALLVHNLLLLNEFPDVEADKIIKNSLLTLNSLDRDKAGRDEFVNFYSGNYQNMKRWVNTCGKDPGELYQAGVSIRAWIEAAILLHDEFREFFEEKAAIMEHDGKLSPEDAEQKAFQHVLSAFE